MVNVKLSSELAALVERKIDSGLYGSANDVVGEALRLMAERDKLQQLHLRYLRRALAEGIAEADRGDLIPIEVVMRRLRERARSHVAKRA
jgi:antitoxin ParD1/3/4